MEIERNRTEKTVSISQKGYLSRVLERFGMQDCNPVVSPTDPTLPLLPSDSQDKDMENVPYREAVGCLSYAAVMSRPDIAYAVNQVARFCCQPNSGHWHAIKRV